MEQHDGTITLRAGSAACLGTALLLAWLAANGALVLAQPWVLAAPLLLAGLRARPWLGGSPPSEFSYGALLRTLTFGGHSESPTYGQLGRLLFLLVAVVSLAMLALHDPTRYGVGLNVYLLLLVLAACFAMSDHDALLTDIVATCGWVLLASREGALGAALVALLAGAALLHGIAFYLAALHYPELDAAAGRRLLRLISRRLALTTAAATVVAVAATAAIYGVGQLARHWLGWPRDTADDAPRGFFAELLHRVLTAFTAWLESWAGGDSLLAIAIRLGLVLAFAAGLAWLGLRLWRHLARHARRAGAAGLQLHLLHQVAAETPDANAYDLTGDWTGTRRALITLYLRTRAQLAKQGYDLRISATPQEYAHFLGRRLPAASAELHQLTALFQAARYAPQPPPADQLATARALQHRILAAARQPRP
jgi:hypothetical protein